MDYQQAQPVIDTAVLNSRRPWYSAKYNDNIQANATTAWGHTQTDPFGSSERIGEKQYELTNHLGNVQATVSDNPYLVAQEATDTILATHPALRSAYDYYPFGMLMPGRYVSDTSQHCVTVTQPTWGWKEVTVACWDVYAWVWPGYTRTGEGTAVVDGDAVKINAPNATDAVSFDFPVTPNVQQELNLDIKQVSLNDKASVQIMEQQGENWVTLAQSPINVVSGGMTIPFRPTGSSIRVVWHGKILVWVRHDCISKLEWVEEDQLVTICDGDKDKYRFGFNGQEKVNEWAGIGNSLDFGSRIYDSRVSRWLSLDPLAKKFSWNTPYSFAENRVIDGVDLDGKEYFYAASGLFLGKIGNSTDVRIVNNKNAQAVSGWITWNNRTANSNYANYAKSQAFRNSVRLGINNHQLMAFSSTIHQETGNRKTGQKDEAYAIGNTTVNYIMSGKAKYLKTLDDVTMFNNTFAQGATQNAFDRFKKLLDKNSKFAVGSAINAVGRMNKIQGFSFSDNTNGATGWDGIDLVHFFRLGNQHRKYTWSSDSKTLLQEYQRRFGDGTININSWKYSDDNYDIKATSIQGSTLYQQVEGTRGEQLQGSNGKNVKDDKTSAQSIH